MEQRNHGKLPSERIASLKQALQEAQRLIDYMNEIKADERYQRREDIRSILGSMRATIDKEVADFNELQTQCFDDLVNGNSIEDIKLRWHSSWVNGKLIGIQPCLLLMTTS